MLASSESRKAPLVRLFAMCNVFDSVNFELISEEIDMGNGEVRQIASGIKEVTQVQCTAVLTSVSVL